MTRRDFLGTMIAGMAMIATCSSRRAVWPVHGSDKGTIRLVFYTDVHARTEWETPTAMALAANAINSHKADLIVAGGDLITDGFQSLAEEVAPRWDVYMKMHREIKGDIYPAIGNHDLVEAIPKYRQIRRTDPRSVFLARMGLDRTYYSFNALGYHFVILDPLMITDDEFKYHGMVWPEELEWLKQDLFRVRHGTPIILVTHIPLLTAFYGATEGATFAAKKNRVVLNNIDVLKILQDHNVILVLQGHLHAKEMIKWRDTIFITGGAVCGKWWRGPWHGTEEGFSVIMLNGNRVHWEYIDYGWKARRPKI